MSRSESSSDAYNVDAFSSANSEDLSEDSDGPLELLLNLEVLQKLLPDITPMEEPTLPQNPSVVRIEYTKSFNYVMGLYRKIRPSFADPRSASSPRWFLLIAFVMRHCNSHYTAWKDRREVIMSAPRLTASTRESLLELGRGDSSFEEVVSPVAEAWLPRRDDIIGSNGEYSPWRAAVWELGAVHSFSLSYCKNFQVWHHRKECLIHALQQTEDATRTGALESFEAFEECVLTREMIQFADIDERILCDQVFEKDSKNYHMWLHRSWFIHAFSFLVKPPSWAALLDESFIGENDFELLPFHPIKHWGRVCMQPDLPSCPLQSELEYTAKVIEKDCLNNSAWCHRFFLFDRDLAAALLRTPVDASAERIDAVFQRLCQAEVHYALQWCYYEPSNESPFVHARCVAAVYQSAALRLWLSGDGAPETAAESLLRAHQSRAPVSLAERVSWERYVRTFALMLQHLQILRESVAPRAEDMRSRASKRDENAIRAIHRYRSQFLLDNVHQVYAAIYHGLFAFLSYTWCHYFTNEDRARVNALLPSETYDEGIDAVNKRIAAVEEDPVSCFLTYEVEAALLAKRLVYEDHIRLKYWKNEVMIVLHREYA